MHMRLFYIIEQSFKAIQQRIERIDTFEPKKTTSHRLQVSNEEYDQSKDRSLTQ